MISAMPAVAVRRERKKQRAAAAAAASRPGSLSSLPSPSTRSSSLISSPMSAPGGYYNYFASQRPQRRPSSSASAPPHPRGSGAPSAAGARSSDSVSTISSAASNYASALHKVRERRLETRRERARFLVYTGSVLMASGAALVVIGLVARATPAPTVGALFLCLGSALCLARVFCLARREELPRVRRARTVSGPSLYASSALQSAASTPDDSSTTSSYYFSAVHRVLPLSPDTPTGDRPALPPLRPPPPVVVPGVHGAGGGHRSNPSSLLTPMSLDSIPEMQVLITDDSQRY